jgi:hypothetical protein
MTVKGQRMSARHLVGKLWTCTDVLPPRYCLQLGLAPDSTYASATRKLMPIPNVYVDCETRISKRATRCRSCKGLAQWV